MPIVTLIQANGKETHHELKAVTNKALRDLAGCDRLDTVNLRDGRVMMADDAGKLIGKPVNPKATNLYHTVCRDGATQKIHGDVVICNDADWE